LVERSGIVFLWARTAGIILYTLRLMNSTYLIDAMIVQIIRRRGKGRIRWARENLSWAASQ
jgi:hypothetical protein